MSIAKTDAKAEIKCCPDKVFDFFKYKLKQFPNILSQVFKKVELLEGEEGQVGNILQIEYVLGTETMAAKTKNEAINEGEKSLTFKAIEGQIMQFYPTFICKVTVADGYMLWSFEYEKANDSVPNPDNYAKLAAQITGCLSSHPNLRKYIFIS